MIGVELTRVQWCCDAGGNKK